MTYSETRPSLLEKETQVTTRVALPSREQIDQLAVPECAQKVVEYRKSGLGLNHIEGCPLD